MATIGNAFLTLSDWAKRMDSNGKSDKVIEILSQTNEILTDAVFVEGNLPTGHKTTVRTGLPTATWRLLNYGVPTSKSTTAQVIDTCGMLESYSEVDKSLADLNGNTGDFRLSESKASLASMNKEMANMLFYGNTAANPAGFLGLAPRYNSLSAENGRMIIDAGSTSQGVNTSIWVVVWGDNTCHGIFPKGSKAGIQQKDLGEVTLEDANGGKYQGYRSHFKWDIGLTLRDWRYVARVANIDVSTLGNAGTATYTGPEIVNLLVKATNQIESLSMGKAAIYCNRDIKTALDLLVINKGNVNLTISDYAGTQTTMFRGVPIRCCDALLNTEELVV